MVCAYFDMNLPVQQSVVTSGLIRKKIDVRGTIQGVGFRPYVFNLAQSTGVTGWVLNSPQGVTIELEGSPKVVDMFLARLERETPPGCRIESLDILEIPTANDARFELRESEIEGPKLAFAIADVATCDQCLGECFDQNDRRYRYPFISCCYCGPRYSIIDELPYDRVRTTMQHFRLCALCQEEYESPQNRRFHAQTNACWECGPSVELWDQRGGILSSQDDALRKTVSELANGAIIAIKGIGGFQLICDASNAKTIERLRRRKHRPDKPFAVMCRDLDQAGHIVHITSVTRTLLRSPAAPIVLMPKNDTGVPIAVNVSPNNNDLGVLLPYSSLHQILAHDFNGPMIATSGNIGDDPICIDEHVAVTTLGGIADYFLVHNRPIRRALDDSVVCEVLSREMILRRARGYTPQPFAIRGSKSDIIAVGGHLKNTIAVRKNNKIILSQHLGDLGTLESVKRYKESLEDLKKMYDIHPAIIAKDGHPEYMSSQLADSSGRPVLSVQHHYAHVLACMAEHRIEPPVLGVAWDGGGYGSDGTLWGGEFLVVDKEKFRRCASLTPFRLPGGKAAIKEPRRAAFGMLFEIYGEDTYRYKDLIPVSAFADHELEVLTRMLANNINSPYCTSIGRLFDGVASLLDLCQSMTFEGQAAIALEQIIDSNNADGLYNITLSGNVDQSLCIDWKPMVRQIIEELREGVNQGMISRKFHNTLAEMILLIAEKTTLNKIVLTGGSFQNRYLTSLTVQRLGNEGFQPYWHRLIPPNDGGLAVGQVMAAIRAKSCDIGDSCV